MPSPSSPRRLVAGNWKMHHKGMSVQPLHLGSLLRERSLRCEVAICPPATLIAAVASAIKDTAIRVGGQDCHPEPSGAFTGDVSAEALKDAGATMVIVGHSERRHGHGESDELVARKVKAAHRAGLAPIVCVGETEGERDGGKTLDVVGRQIARSVPADVALGTLVVAYEPVWAIGSGKVPSNGDIEAVHGFIRAELVRHFGAGAASVPILYGGSVKPSNAKEILALKNVDGALVGGASLKAEDFIQIIDAA